MEHEQVWNHNQVPLLLMFWWKWKPPHIKYSPNCLASLHSTFFFSLPVMSWSLLVNTLQVPLCWILDEALSFQFAALFGFWLSWRLFWIAPTMHPVHYDFKFYKTLTVTTLPLLLHIKDVSRRGGAGWLWSLYSACCLLLHNIFPQPLCSEPTPFKLRTLSLLTMNFSFVSISRASHDHLHLLCPL